MGAGRATKGADVYTSEMEIADRVTSMVECFEAKSGMTSQQFEQRYQSGEFPRLAWALAWHEVIAGRMPAEALTG